MGEAPPDNSRRSPSLSNLMQTTGLWRASSIDCHYRQQTPSGFSELDAELPGGGWPAAGLSELLHDKPGIGEFRLLLPGLARLSQTQGRWLLLVSPPYIPYPPALAQAGINLSRVIVTRLATDRDYLWVMEKALASQSCSAVVAWPGKLQSKQLRRLQVASKGGGSWGILLRAKREAANPSPAELRLLLEPSKNRQDNSAVTVTVMKRRGSWQSGAITIHFDDELQRPMPDFSEMQVSAGPCEDTAEPVDQDVSANRQWLQ